MIWVFTHLNTFKLIKLEIKPKSSLIEPSSQTLLVCRMHVQLTFRIDPKLLVLFYSIDGHHQSSFSWAGSFRASP
jgi:hypothetical protein